MDSFPINDFLSGTPVEGVSTPMLNGFPFQQTASQLSQFSNVDKKRQLDVSLDGNGKKKKTKKKEVLEEEDENGEKRRVSKACVFCQRSHMSCDSGRPCKRCVDRGVPELCVDPIPKRRGRRRKFLDTVEEATLSTLHTQGQDATMRIAASVPPSNPMLSPINFNDYGMTPSHNSPPSPGSSPNSNSPEPDSSLNSNDSEESTVNLPPNLLSELFFSPMEQFGNIMSERQSFQNAFDQQQKKIKSAVLACQMLLLQFICGI